jgi:hypothetical protein
MAHRPGSGAACWKAPRPATCHAEAAQREIRTALDFLAAHPQQLQAVAQQRADALLADHQRVREATRDVGQYSVSPCPPVDVMGVYVLLPDSL